MPFDLNQKTILSFRKDYLKDGHNLVMEHAVTSNGIQKTCVDLERKRVLPNLFSIDVDCGKVTNQRRSGRCWMFAGLNVLRKILIDKLHVEDIECSQAYLQFYDKLEKSNFFLEKILELAGEDLSSQKNIFLLESAIGDGGHWAMFVNLVKKYGILPSYAMPDLAVSMDTTELNALLSKILKKDALKLRETASKKSTEEARKLKNRMLEEIYRVLSISLGLPVESFTFEYRDKDKKYHNEGEMTPLEFFHRYIGCSLMDYVPLTDAPLPLFEKGVKYTSSLVNNVIGGDPVVFYTSDIKTIKEGAIRSLKNNEPLWFAADVGAQSLRKDGYLDSSLYDYEGVFGVDLLEDKGQRLYSRFSVCSHAMCLVGVNLVRSNKADRWKVENSWGKENGFDGFYIMSDKWFSDNVFQVIVHRKYLPEAVLEAYDKAPIVDIDPFNTLF